MIPLGWAINREGNPVEDPREISEDAFRNGGGLLGIGHEGYKGFGLSVMVNILTSVLSGGAHYDGLSEFAPYNTPERDSFAVVAVNIEYFLPFDDFVSQMDNLVQITKSCKLAPGTTEIYLPGEQGFRRREERRRVVPRDRWRFARRTDSGEIVTDRTRVYLEGGFQPHRLYDVVYVAQDPPLVGLGPAAVRDTISHLKYAAAPELSIPAGALDRAIAWGVSQSGRFLRTFLYHGFNADEAERKAFDGVMAHVAGGGRGSFNHRFAQPSRDGHPFLNKLYPTDIFPFTDVTQTDPDTDMRDGLLGGIKPAHMPKMFHTNSSYEYWGRAASLIHTTLDGARDSPLMDNVRVYSFAGGQHGPGRFPPRQTSGQQLSNPNDYSWFLRSLLLAMNRWAIDGTPPPASVYPRIANGDLVLPEDLAFPEIPGVSQPAVPHLAYRAVYGPEFRTRGIVTVEPPEVLSAFPILVPRVDADGNETGGLMMPEVAVPLATYTGWNNFRPESGPMDVLSSMQGSYIPLPITRDAADERGDPRASIEERYTSRAEYLGLVSNAALALVDDGYLLAGDLAPILARAQQHWDYLMEDDTEQ